MSIDGKVVLLDQIGACHDDPSWVVPVQAALAGLTAAQAAQRDTPATHSVWQIVNHLTYWNEHWLERFRGTPLATATDDNDTTFNDTTFADPIDPGDDAAWASAVQRLSAVLSAWRSELADCAEAKLAAKIPDFPVDAAWWGAVSNLTMHNSYHLGQIVHIRKHQGTWTGGS